MLLGLLQALHHLVDVDDLVVLLDHLPGRQAGAVAGVPGAETDRHLQQSVSQSEALSLVQISPDTGLSLVDTLLCNMYYASAKVYAITTHLKASIFCLSVCSYGMMVNGC